ncbi:carboxymuconolactone decarboxylase [Fusarium acutatum]|uniref:Carboxymuconolactone decarboxylase n=1 Tax=Fusarium acutatum TaxID=78861 RepID=A0A8H4JR18_9HYPO|nr:carboxymuconolactone decarboxylase [Fusarium acutatum]
MAASLDFLEKYRQAESDIDITEQTWYLAAAAALAGANVGARQPDLYRLATKDLPVEKELIVQRRIKEVILKLTLMIGNPRSLGSLIPLFGAFKPDVVDLFGPRTEEQGDTEALERRKKRAADHFATLWSPDAARSNNEILKKNHTDAHLLLAEWGYAWWFSEDRILSLVETQIALAGGITLSNAPMQATWHTRGIVRCGGSREIAERSQNLYLEVGRKFNVLIGDVQLVQEMDFEQPGFLTSFAK